MRIIAGSSARRCARTDWRLSTTAWCGSPPRKWRADEPLDLWHNLYRLTRNLAIGLLFGGDYQHGYPIADMIAGVLQRKWAPSVIGFPVNLPITPYGQVVRQAQTLERL